MKLCISHTFCKCMDEKSLMSALLMCDSIPQNNPLIKGQRMKIIMSSVLIVHWWLDNETTYYKCVFEFTLLFVFNWNLGFCLFNFSKSGRSIWFSSLATTTNETRTCGRSSSGGLSERESKWNLVLIEWHQIDSNRQWNSFISIPILTIPYTIPPMSMWSKFMSILSSPLEFSLWFAVCSADGRASCSVSFRIRNLIDLTNS